MFISKHEVLTEVIFVIQAKYYIMNLYARKHRRGTHVVTVSHVIHLSSRSATNTELIQSSQVIAKAFVCVREFGESVV